MRPAPPAGLLLVVNVPAAAASAPLAGALLALPCLSRAGTQYEGTLTPGCDAALRELAACLSDGVVAFVHHERAAVAGAPAPYERLWDRTDELAAAMTAWKRSCGPFPSLQPGDIVRL